MGRSPKDIDRSGLWHETVVVDFMARHPQGMYRPVDLDGDPETRIEAMPWWEGRPALMLFGCADAPWDEPQLLLWSRALSLAAEARGAVVEIACFAQSAVAEVDFGKLDPGFRWRSRPQTKPGQAYFHLVRIPSEHERPPPLTVAEMISTAG